MKSFFLRIWQWVKNPFLTSTVLFVAWMIFFDSNSYVNRRAQVNQLEELEARESLYKDGIEELGEELQAIDDDPEQLEKFAREKFFYKEKGEDIFVLEEKKEEEEDVEEPLP